MSTYGRHYTSYMYWTCTRYRQATVTRDEREGKILRKERRSTEK